MLFKSEVGKQLKVRVVLVLCFNFEAGKHFKYVMFLLFLASEAEQPLKVSNFLCFVVFPVLSPRALEQVDKARKRVLQSARR